MSQLKHYAFYPVAYVYGASIKAMRLLNPPCSTKSVDYCLWVSDTTFCNSDTYSFFVKGGQS